MTDGQPPAQPISTGQPLPLGDARQLTEDRVRLAVARRESLNSFISTSVGERSRSLRDSLGVIVTMVIGSLALFFTDAGSRFISTQWLFFLSLGVLALAALVNLWAKSVLISHLERITYGVESNYLAFIYAARAYLLTPNQTNLDTLGREDFSPSPLPDMNWVGKHGYLVVSILIGASVVGLTLSLVFKIT